MARTRLAFIFSWGLFMLFAQIPVLLIGSAFNYEPTLMLILEVFTAIITAMITALMIVKEDM